MGPRVTVTIDGQEYVAIPRADYLRMTGGSDLVGAADAVEYARASIARSLVQAREAGGLTQSELAKRLRVSQSMIANAEAGRTKVSERYMARVLKACRLAKGWAGPMTSTADERAKLSANGRRRSEAPRGRQPTRRRTARG
jgi:transcriptional regulator with XRE-family HTH domain